MDVFVPFPDEDIPTHQGENPRKVTPQPFSFPVPSFQLFLQLPYPGLGLLPSRAAILAAYRTTSGSVRVTGATRH